MNVSAAFPVVILAVSALVSQAAPGEAGVGLERLGDRVRVSIDGQVFTEYRHANSSRPYCYPVYGPGQVAMTRNWPMKEAPGEERDHPHHLSLWFAHGAVNGVDFWSESPGAGRIVHRKFDRMESGPSEGILQSSNDWMDKNGKVVCTDQRTLRFSKSKLNNDSRILDFEINIYASTEDLHFGDTKEGTLAIRVAESMKVKREGARGHIVNSEGTMDAETWGKRAEWCDYYGPVEGKEAGIAILDHPSNPRHPTWWHVRDYGLFAANPFGKHDFEKLPDPQAGTMTVRKGTCVSFKYRFVFHKGDPKTSRVKEEYDVYAKGQ